MSEGLNIGAGPGDKKFFELSGEEKHQHMKDAVRREDDRQKLEMITKGELPGLEREVPLCEFGIALRLLKEGKSVTRKGWNGAGQYLSYIVPLEGTKMTVPYIFITTVQGDRVPWAASQTDLLAMDWHPVYQ